MKTIRVIGDVHGCISTRHPRKNVSYHDLIAHVEYSIQIGDMGFNYSGLKGLGNKHVFIPGNHDNYDTLPVQALDTFGNVALGPFAFFYVRGAWSIDVKKRKQLMAAGQPKMWWYQEQLTDREMDECYKQYAKSMPDVVITHTCPAHISEEIGNPGIWSFFGWKEPQFSRTQYLLQKMYSVHQPKLWIFGHFHKTWFHQSGETQFICIDELDFLDFNEKWEIV